MRAQPPLHVTDSPQWNFFSKTKQRSENKYGERNCAESQAERCSADGMMLGRLLHPRGGQSNQVRIKIADIQGASHNRGDGNKKEPREMLPISDTHGRKLIADGQ